MRDEISGTENDVMSPKAVDGEGGPRPSRSRFSAERAGEALLLTAVTSLYVYFWIDSLSWPDKAKILPYMALALGLPFLLMRWYRVLRGGRGEGGSAQIMDTGFRSSGDAKDDVKRFVRVTTMVVLIILGIWLVGVEITVPLGVVIYLFFFAGAGIVKSAIMGLVLLGVVMGLYNEILNAPWPTPLLWGLFKGG